jgi:molecular chaperone HtpG
LYELDEGGDDRPRLICNDRHPLVSRLVDCSALDQEVVASAVQALYGQALLLAHRRLRGVDLALQNRALLDLVERATAR